MLRNFGGSRDVPRSVGVLFFLPCQTLWLGRRTAFVLLLALFSELPEEGHHVCDAHVSSESTLGFWEVVLSDGRYQSV